MSDTLKLLDRIVTRVCLAEDEDSLKKAVDDSLAPILGTLASSSSGEITKKCIDTLVTIFDLVKGKDTLELPLEDLIDSWRDSTDKSRSMVQIFLVTAIERRKKSNMKEIVSLFPSLLIGIHRIPVASRQTLLRSLVSVIVELGNSGGDLSRDEHWNTMLKDENDRRVFLDWTLKLLLLPAVSADEDSFLTCGGKKPLVWPQDSLAKTKAALMKMFDLNDLFPETPEIFQHICVALGDGNPSVQERAHTVVTRRRNDLEKESEKLMDQALKLLERTNPPVTFNVRDATIAQLCKSAVVAAPPLLPRTLKIALATLFSEETSSRLKNRGIQLLRWLLKHMKSEHLAPFALGIVAGLLQLVAKQLEIPATESIREGAYTMIGAVIRTCGEPFRGSLAIPSALASSLARDGGIRDALRMALFEMGPSFSYKVGVSEDDLVKFLKGLSDSPVADVRAVAARWCRDTLPFNNADARVLALRLSEDEQNVVSREGRLALNPEKGDKYPSFPEMLKSVHAVDSVAEIPPPWHVAAIHFLWRCLGKPEETLMQFDSDVLLSWDKFLWRAMEHGRVTSALPTVACQHLATTLSFDPQKFLSITKDSWSNTRWEMAALNAYGGSCRSDARPLFATLASMVHACLSPSNQVLLGQVDTRIEKLCSVVASKSIPLERLASAVYFLGLLVSVHPNASKIAVEKFGVIKALMKSSEEPVLVSACLSAMSELCRRSVFSEAAMYSEVLDLVIESNTSVLAKSQRSVAENSVQCMSSICLAIETLGDSEKKKDVHEKVVATLFKTCPASPHQEIAWISGETIAIIFQGWGTECAKDVHWKWYDERFWKSLLSKNQILGCDSEMVKKVLYRIFREPLASGNIKQRECVAVWILSILRYSCQSVVEAKELEHSQQALSLLLSDPSSFTREAASRALLYAWDQGGESERSALLQGLVRDFNETGGKQKVDREVFPDDAMRTPKSDTQKGDKESFKQLAGVAKQVDSKLAPSLFSLASDSNAWTGGVRSSAFDSDNNRLIKAARTQLLPYLGKMFPTLWRGQYWPGVYVAQAFRRVLKTLASPSQDDGETMAPAAEFTMKEMLNKYFSETCKFVIEGAQSKDEDSRNASLSCLSDLLSGRSWDECREFFSEFWRMVLCGMDDLRDSVRDSAKGASSTLSNLTCRLVDPEHADSPQQASEALDLSIQQILKYGVSCAAKEVQVSSVVLLKAVVKAAKGVMEPHVADVLEKLLHCASVLEPEMISYISLHSDKLDITGDKLHAARASMARMTPLGECIDECLRWVRPSNILQIVSSIESGLKGAGLPTLLQSTWAVTTLCRDASAIELIKGKPATSLAVTLLNIMERQSGNTSAVKELCQAIGSVSGLASNKYWSKKLVPLLFDLYFVKGEVESFRFFSGYLSKSLVNDNRGGDVLKGRLKDVIALVWIGKNDAEKKVRDEFNECFVGLGAPSSVSLYNQEILTVIQNEIVNCKSWEVKRQVFRGLEMLSSHLSGHAGMLNDTVAMVLNEAQSPKHWKGKGSALRSLACLVSVMLAGEEVNEDVIVESVFALSDEMSKKGPTRTTKYKTAASKALLSVARQISVSRGHLMAKLWERLWSKHVKKIVTSHTGDKQYVTIRECCFLVMSYCFVANEALDSEVFDTIVAGVLKQSSSEVRVASLKALQRLFVFPDVWTVERKQMLIQIISVSLCDKFKAVRECTAQLVLSTDFDNISFNDMSFDLMKIDSYSETKVALEKLKEKTKK